jgi:hypothetical protein
MIWLKRIDHLCLARFIKWLVTFFISSLIMHFDKPLYWCRIGCSIPRCYSSGYCPEKASRIFSTAVSIFQQGGIHHEYAETIEKNKDDIRVESIQHFGFNVF